MSTAGGTPEDPTGSLGGRGGRDTGDPGEFRTFDARTFRTVDPSAMHKAGESVGAYKLISKLGEGGCGEVWLAERRDPFVQKVALKLIKPGMDSRSVIARFEQERQALAMMNHPHIAKVLDGGLTPLGRPYFVMEHVNGTPITEFCDARKLSVKDRLQLFTQACEAVQHAHLKGIVHRDLKPSNILAFDIEGEGPKLKVIDFGVAKAMSQALTDKTIFTETGQMIGTPAYMSPEQADPGVSDVDTRSDIYALGILLYELVAGVTPFDAKTLRAKAYGEIQRIIREEDPPTPSARLSTISTKNAELAGRIEKSRGMALRELARELKSELEWIPLKAMRKEPQNRYQNALDLRRDIDSYLEGRPISAAPESTGYRVRKYIRRNKALVTGVGAVAVALVTGFGTALWQAQRASAARDAEKERADQLQQVSDFQSQLLGQIDTTSAGVELMRDVRERFVEALERAGVPEASRLVQVKTLEDLLVRVNATDAAAAMIDRAILKPAIQSIEVQFKNDPATDASLRQALAMLYQTIGLYDSAFPLQESALEKFRRTLGEEHPDTLSSMSNMGSLLKDQGRLAEAEPFYRESLEKSRRALGEEHPDTLTSINNMGVLLQAQGKPAEAEPFFREALAKRRRALGEEHPDTLNSISNIGVLLQDQGKVAEAEPFYREALEKRRLTLGEAHPQTLISMNNMGVLLQDQGRFTEAEPFCREALEKSRRTLGEEHPQTLISIGNMGALLQAQGRLAEAEPYLREALEKSRRTLGEEHPDTLSSICNLGMLLEAQSRLAEAEPYFREALEKSRRALGEEHPDTLRSMSNLSGLLQAQGRLAEAEPYLREAIERRRRMFGEQHPDTLGSIIYMGVLLRAQGRLAEAEPYLREALVKYRRVLGEEHPDTLFSIGQMGSLLHAQGRLADAEPLCREALEKSLRTLGEERPETLVSVSLMLRLKLDQDKAPEALDLALLHEPGARKAFTGGSARRLADFLTSLGCARVGGSSDAERFVRAEANLLEAHAIYLDAKDRGPTHKDTLECVQALVDLYAAWDTAEPGKGYDAKAAEWKTKLDAANAASSTAPSTEKK